MANITPNLNIVMQGRLTPGVKYAGETNEEMRSRSNLDITPWSTLDSELSDLQNTVLGHERNLRETYPKSQQLAAAITDLQEQYNRKKSTILAKQANLQRIDDLVKQGAINSQLGEEAKWRTVLPEETQAAMFPKAAQTPTVTPGQFTSVEKRAEEYIAGTYGWGKKEHKDLIPTYFNFLQNEAVIQGVNDYSELSPVQKKQVNQAWDNMNKTANTRWNPNDPGLRPVRSPGKLGQAKGGITSNFSRTIVKNKSETKLGNALEKFVGPSSPIVQRPRDMEKRPLDRETAISILKEAKGNKQKARELAKARGYDI